MVAQSGVDVDKRLFDVTMTISKDYMDGITREEMVDILVEQYGFKSATLNEDGSVTFVMTKVQHKEMLDEIRQSINDSLAEMVESEEYPNITAVTVNDDYSKFTITTKNEELDSAESYAVFNMYNYGGEYAVYSGEEVDNIQVDYVNADSGEVIRFANFNDMVKDD